MTVLWTALRRLGRMTVPSAILLLTVLTISTVEAGPPTDQLKNRVDRIIQVLSDPEMMKNGRTVERRATLRKIAGEVFDFTEISKRSLARHWQARTPAEREEFVRLYSDLLERAYVGKLELYTGERIEYPGEIVDGDVVTVKTRIITKQGTPIPVDYRMFQENGQWKAYDALIEGVSLIANYRSQFNTVIQRSGYDGLVKALRAKAEEAAPPRAPGKGSGGAAEALTPASRRQQTP